MYEDLFAECGLSLERLRAFVEVVDAGGMAKAAPGDSVRQSQLSRQIRDLDEFFGTPLLERRGRGKAPTEAGLALAAVIRRQFLELEDFRNRCRSMPHVFRIGAGDSVLQWLVVPAIERLRGQLPDARIELYNQTTVQRLTALEEGAIDFGILRHEGLPTSLARKPLGTIDYALAVPVRLLRRIKGERFEDIIGKVPLAGRDLKGTLWTDLHAWARRQRISIRPDLVCESYPQAVSAVRAGAFAAILPAAMAGLFESSSVKVIEEMPFKTVRRKLALVWQKRTAATRPAVERAAEALGEVLQLK